MKEGKIKKRTKRKEKREEKRGKKWKSGNTREKEKKKKTNGIVCWPIKSLPSHIPADSIPILWNDFVFILTSCNLKALQKILTPGQHLVSQRRLDKKKGPLVGSIRVRYSSQGRGNYMQLSYNGINICLRCTWEGIGLNWNHLLIILFQWRNSKIFV